MRLLLFYLLISTPVFGVCIKDDNGEIISCSGDKGDGYVDIDSRPSWQKFFQYDEQINMAHTVISDHPVILDTDFIKHSVNAARFITDIYEIKHNGALFAIIERRDRKAILVDQIAYDEIVYGACNRSQCTSGIIAGTIKGMLQGGALGATAGTPFGLQGAAGGLVIGGTGGAIYGGMDGYAQTDACNCPDGSGSDSGSTSNGNGMGNDDDPKDKEIPKNEE